jgi:DNA-binding transcriptional ArsR family regulator
MPAPQTDLSLDALGNALRRDMVRLLGERPMSVAELAAHFPVSRPAISRHLAQLAEAGLVRHRAEGTRHFYELRLEGFAQTVQWLESFWDEAEARLRMVAENTAPEPRDQ